MEIEMEEIIVDEELEIEDIELDVIKKYSGEGTSDYKKLKNKPQINGIELVGNKTTKDLGIEAGKEIHIGAEEPTGDETIWIDPTEEPDKIPTKTSELENDSKFATETFVTNKIAEAELGGEDIDLSGFAKKEEIPTKVSELENDSGFITEIPEEYAKKTDIPDVSNFAKKSDIPSIDGLATEEYVDNAIANIDIPEGGGSSGGSASEVLIDFTTEEEVQTLEFPLSNFDTKINNAQDIIVELIVKKPVADEGTAYGNLQVTFYSPMGNWNKAVLFQGAISPSNGVSWGKDGYGLTAIKKGIKTWVGNQMALADNATALKTTIIGGIWRDVSKDSGDKFKISSALPMGIGTRIRLIVSGVEQ